MAYQNSPILVDETSGIKHYCTCGESSNKPYCDGSHSTKATEKISERVNSGGGKKICNLRLRQNWKLSYVWWNSFQTINY